MKELFSDVHFWYAIAFFALVGIVWKKAAIGIKQGLDSRIAQVTRQLEDARNLRAEAQKLFDQYDQQMKEADKTAHEIIENAQIQAKAIRAHAVEEAARMVERQTLTVESQIRNAEIQAIAQVREEAGTLTMNMVRALIDQHLNDSVQRDLVSQSIDTIAAGRLN